MKKIFKSYGIALLIVAIYAFVKLPVLRFDFTSGFTMLILFFVLAGVLDMMFDRGERTSKSAKNNFLIAGVLLVVIIIIPFFVTSPIFRASSYKDLLGKVEESVFTEDVSPVSVDKIRIVDKDMAIKLGEKKLGEIPAIGSISKVGDYSIQSVKGELYWIAPLVHRDIIKWITNLEGTNGYIMVSASNPQDVRLVQNLDGKQLKIVYQEEAYFLQDLHRHVYLNGGMKYGMTDFNFEIDDNGKPYWVVTLYEHAVGYGGSNAVGTAIVDAQSGEVKIYSIKDTPKWVDRIQPESFIVDQINNWGLYVKGFINSVISEEGVLLPSEGTSLVYGEDGKSYWYTGITSAGGDESTVGFMLVDSRTKESKLYMQTGATETAAMTTAEGKVQEKNYKATFPVMYNILGKPTYVLGLKDKADLVKMVAFVSVEDYSIIGMGDTKEDAYRNYKEALESKGNDIDFNTSENLQKVEGTVSRINQDVKSGNTIYYITLKDKKELIFTGTSKISSELPLTIVGDKVSISYDKTDSNIISIAEFDNTNIGKIEKTTKKEKNSEKSDNNEKTE
ncbi:hypothetical protein [Terrisporobacter mayombei]|uniref:Cell shape-determining protein n=1 Tax=Terrisporobacter mayombei TaxID=1541 RepID=A0ABY9PZG1_9FIRM|nr:hypothetical protein [Terrisporobacter mayombei]MCC3868421.1 hypothetical protein [Terrisporobacter mayombei]WMT80569.1 hypothetical protein TEMA_08880 [Terrisporobacter mayombei]